MCSEFEIDTQHCALSEITDMGITSKGATREASCVAHKRSAARGSCWCPFRTDTRMSTLEKVQRSVFAITLGLTCEVAQMENVTNVAQGLVQIDCHASESVGKSRPPLNAAVIAKSNVGSIVIWDRMLALLWLE